MIRTPNGSYKQQGRSKNLQKYKKFMDEEFEVVGHHEGTGAHAGTAIFECRSNVNREKIFGVTMQGTLESKRGMMENVLKYYGKMLTVKYQEKSNEGVPRFPVGLEFRDYE
jgi:DNA ligase-1